MMEHDDFDQQRWWFWPKMVVSTTKDGDLTDPTDLTNDFEKKNIEGIADAW